MGKYSVVDLFAGAGGLSLGFAQTKKYDIKVAFENNPDMQKTYHLNHPNVKVLGDVCQANYSNIQREYGKIDVVIGGPPCQGFSNANRQKNHAISQNNMLVKQYIRAIVELQPKAFVMENVSMLKSEVHRFYMEKRDVAIVERYDIPVKKTTLPLIDKKFAFAGAIGIVQNRELIETSTWPEEHYFELNIVFKMAKNIEKLEKSLTKHKVKLMEIASLYVKNNATDYISQCNKKAFSAIVNYYNGVLDIGKIAKLLTPAIMVQRMLSKALEIIDNDILVDRYLDENGISAEIRSFAVYDYLNKILSSNQNNYQIASKVLCAADYGAPQKRMRFVVIGVKRTIASEVALPIGIFKEATYQTVRDAIEDLEDVEPVTELKADTGIILTNKKLGKLGKALRNAELLRNHIVTQTTETALERFRALSEGQNFHALKNELKINTYTDASRTQNTIYLRLKYDEPSGTVVNVRKSMWIHPHLDRAISVREAARLQTFPDSFIFCGSKDKQYQQVGNAVPPIMAKSIAKKLAKLLNTHDANESDGSQSECTATNY